MVLHGKEDTTTKERSSLCNLFELDDKTKYGDLGLNSFQFVMVFWKEKVSFV
jgi:hypothetical protein